MKMALKSANFILKLSQIVPNVVRVVVRGLGYNDLVVDPTEAASNEVAEVRAEPIVLRSRTSGIEDDGRAARVRCV